MNLNRYIILLPLVLVMLSIPFEEWSMEISRVIKLFALSTVVLYVLYKRQKDIYVSALLFFTGCLILLTIYNETLFYPALEDGLRYLIPIIAIIYSLQLKSKHDLVLKILIGYVLLNNLYQLFDSILHMIITKQIVINRATGFVGFFDFFGFINLMALVIINEMAPHFFTKHKFYINGFFSLFILWSLSLKIVILFLIYALFRHRKTLLVPLILIIGLILTQNTSIFNAISLRINRYIINMESARNESYKVVFNNLNDFWLIGTGPGTFGGPASTKYGSYLYEKYNFNWFGEIGMATTDTYYPHLIVELGLFISIIYLITVFILPILMSRNKTIAIIIILILALNSVFSFALNSINYCFFSLILIFLIDGNKQHNFTIQNNKRDSFVAKFHTRAYFLM